MDHAPVRIPTSLRNAPRNPKTSAEIAAECQRAWLERGIVVILDVAAIANDFARAAVVNEATRLYGRRMKP
jgi:hypothetical protein